MTKAEARRLAAEARRYGHTDLGYDAVSGATRLQVRCPACRAHVVGYMSPYDPQGNTAVRALDRAMVEHALDDCHECS